MVCVKEAPLSTWANRAINRFICYHKRMVHVSKKELPASVAHSIDVQLVRVFTDTKTGSQTKNLLDEILGHEERTALAKRLAALIMLLQDISPYRISRLLFLSTSTVRRIEAQMHSGSYEYLVRFIQKQKDIESFWKTLDTVVHMGLPPYKHGHWKRFSTLKKPARK